MRSRTFLGHAVVYGLGNTLLQAVGIVLLPLYTRCLSPAEYGVLEVFNRVGELAAICLLLNCVRQAVIVFHGQGHGDQDRRRVAGAAVVIVLVAAALGGVLALVALVPLAGALGVGAAGPLMLAVLAALLEAGCTALLALSQARMESLFFVCVTVSQVAARVLLSVLFVAALGWGIVGVLWASLLTSAVYLSVVAGREALRGPLAVDWRRAGEMVTFALPLVVCGLCFYLLNNGDRFVLLHFGGRAEVGLYALGYKLAAAAALFSRGPLMMVWGPRVYAAAKAPDAPEVFGLAFTRILGACLFAGLGLCVLQDEVVAVVAGPAYAASAAVIAPVVLGYCFLAAADLMDSAFYVRRRTGLKTSVALLSTTVMLGLYAGLIPPFGAAGAAWATALGFAVHAALTWSVARPLLTVRYEPGRVAAMFALAVGLWLASRAFPTELWAVPVKLVLWLLWPVALWWLGLVSDREKAAVRSALTPLWARLKSGHCVTGKYPVTE